MDGSKKQLGAAMVGKTIPSNWDNWTMDNDGKRHQIMTEQAPEIIHSHPPEAFNEQGKLQGRPQTRAEVNENYRRALNLGMAAYSKAYPGAPMNDVVIEHTLRPMVTRRMLGLPEENK